MTTEGIYIYGIIPNIYGTEYFRLLKNSGVNFISFQNISAIVSKKETAHIDFLDRESLAHLLIHHQKTIEEIMAIGFNMILPMKLGTIVNGKKDVLNILENGYDLIITTLKKIEYLTEIDMVVTWDNFPGILKEISDHPEIIAIKDDILKKTDMLSQVDQVKVGMLVQRKLNEKNKSIELKILEALSSFCLDIKIHEVMNDQMVTNSAFLVNRNTKEKFEKVIDRLDEEFNSTLKFKIIGPLPFYSFYTLNIEKLDPEIVMQAKNDLGLKEETSEAEIKKAYLGKAKLFHPNAQQKNGDKEHFNKINKAYHTLLDYSVATKQLSNDDYISFAQEKLSENLILVKIKE